MLTWLFFIFKNVKQGGREGRGSGISATPTALCKLDAAAEGMELSATPFQLMYQYPERGGGKEWV